MQRSSLPARRRRRLRAGVWLLALLLLTGCDDAIAPGASTVITSGYSYGECLGFCFHEMTCRGAFATYVRRDFRTGETLETKARLDIDAWGDLVGAVDMQALRALPDVIGCPDCADGGAEWIEVVRDGVGKRVTFEAGADIPSIQPLLDAARARRAALQP